MALPVSAIPFQAIGAIAQAIALGPEGGKYAAMSIAGIDPTAPSRLLLPERTFQYWPDSISDTMEIGWSTKDIPGASHALMQWASNGGRTLSFEIQLHRFMRPSADVAGLDQLADPFKLNKPDAVAPRDNRPYNVDVAAEIRFLRSFCYPTYAKDNQGITVAYNPPIAILCAPNVHLNEDGSDTIFTVMTGCDVTYNLLFPNGVPRRATVALTFKQIVQQPQKGVFFKGFQDGLLAGRDVRSDVASPGGSRPTNKITGREEV